VNQNTTQTIAFEPDGDTSTILNQLYTATGFSTNNFIFYNRTIPNDAEQGKWNMRVIHTTSSYGTQIYNYPFWVAQTCQANYTFINPHTVNRYYKASNTINSSSLISNNRHIIYDAENIVTLTTGFRSVVGSKLEIKTAGCH
jgi:hypothetical protein